MFPAEVASLFATSADAVLRQPELLIALPEHNVIIPPRNSHPPQTDLFVPAKASDGGLVSITVEGKIDEAFGAVVSLISARGL